MPRVRIGLTGGIASGKSTVADILADLGAVIIDSDVLAREVVQPGTPGLDKIIERFGVRVLHDGELDRSVLGDIVFDDPGARHDLEAIVHPAVRQSAAEREAAAGPEAVVVQMIPLLVETGQESGFDSVWVVDAAEETQIARLVSRDGLTDAQARSRVAAQAGRAKRLAAADVVIENPGVMGDRDVPFGRQADVSMSGHSNPERGESSPPAAEQLEAGQSRGPDQLYERVADAYHCLVGSGSRGIQIRHPGTDR